MSDLNIRRALASTLVNAGIPLDRISFENTSFDPTGKDYYVAFYFFPTEEAAMGKLQTDSVDQSGFVQVSVFVKMNLGDYGTLYYQTIDTLKSAFLSGLETSYNGQVVEIQDSTNINPTESESWYQGGLTINYQAFKARV